MKMNEKIRKILSYYEADNPGTKSNLAKILMHGKLANSGKIIILPVDQGFEHGPIKSFAVNEMAYDPHYHYRLAVDCGFSAYAAPLGMLESGIDTFINEIPLILKVNSGDALTNNDIFYDQAITSSVKDALRLGCAAIGITIYPGSKNAYNMYEKVRALSLEAKENGLAVVIWAYPRGNISKENEMSLYSISYSAHIAALLGAHIIKVKLPTDFVESDELKLFYKNNDIDISSLSNRISCVVKSCFNGKRLVVFSGGSVKNTNDVAEEAYAINIGGGNGSIIGRNTFQRSREEAMSMIDMMINVYKSE